MATPGAPKASGQEEDINNNKTVAFLGPINSYSHQATKIAFPDGSGWHLEPTGTIRDVFDRVQSKQAPYGVVPFENSTHGTVTFTLDNLADRAAAYGDILVCDEVYLDVHHFLLGRLPPLDTSSSSSLPPSSSSLVAAAAAAAAAAAPSPAPSSNGPGDRNSESEAGPPKKGVPLSSLRHVRRLYSHPQAFGQTGLFVARHLPHAEAIDVSSTSRAAELAAADTDGSSAAIASEGAGKGFGLDVLARCVEDREDNTTRFFVLRRRDEEGPLALPERMGGVERAEGSGAGGDDDDDHDDDVYGGGKYKSLVSFTVPHRTPGALADVLECFRRWGLNLTSISSVPSLVGPFQYLFFVEFEGSRLDDPEGKVSGALEDLEKVAERWRWLGSWRNRRGER